MTMSNDDWAYSRKINVDYSSEVTCENFNSMYEVLNKRFETLFKFDRSRDADNVMFYYRNKKICAFYDYERSVGYFDAKRAA